MFAVLAATIGESTVDGSEVSFELTGAEAALYLALVLLYYFALEVAIGQTVGKLLLGVRVVRTDGSRPPLRPSPHGHCFGSWTGCRFCTWSDSSPRWPLAGAHGLSTD